MLFVKYRFAVYLGKFRIRNSEIDLIEGPPLLML